MNWMRYENWNLLLDIRSQSVHKQDKYKRFKAKNLVQPNCHQEQNATQHMMPALIIVPTYMPWTISK